MNAPDWTVLLAKLAPGIALALLLVGLLGVFLRRPADPDRRLRRPGSWLMPGVLIAYWYWLITPIIGQLSRRGVRPNHLTLGALGLGVLAGVALGAGALMTGVWLLVAAATLDLLDGLLARHLQVGSKSGAFLDSFADRCAEVAVFAGLAYYGAGGPLSWAAIWALSASLLISYARARAEGLGVDCDIGLMQRPERTFWLIVTLFVAAIVEALGAPSALQPHFAVAAVGVAILAFLSTITAFRRADWAFKALCADPNNHRNLPGLTHAPNAPDAYGPSAPRPSTQGSLESEAEAAR